MIRSFEELESYTRSRINSEPVPRLGIIFPGSGKCIEAVNQAKKDGFAVPTMLGPESEIKKIIAGADLDIDDYEYIDTNDLATAVKTGVEMVKEGKLDFLLKGSIGTRELVDILIKPETGFAGKKDIISHVGVLRTDKYPKFMFVTDCAVNAVSDAGVKIAVTQNAAGLARMMGNESPKAALLAAVEAIYPQIPVTMEEAAIAKMSDRGQIKGSDIDGPLSFDVAINTEVAHSKGITNSKVAGDTDLFVCPSVETANGLYKAMVLYVKAESAGIILGGAAPVVTTFVCDSAESVLNSITLGAYVVKSQ